MSDDSSKLDTFVIFMHSKRRMDYEFVNMLPSNLIHDAKRCNDVLISYCLSLRYNDVLNEDTRADESKLYTQCDDVFIPTTFIHSDKHSRVSGFIIPKETFIQMCSQTFEKAYFLPHDKRNLEMIYTEKTEKLINALKLDCCVSVDSNTLRKSRSLSTIARNACTFVANRSNAAACA